MPKTETATLGRIVQESRGEHVAIVYALRQEALRDVEAVPTVGDGHAIEETPRAGWQDAVRRGCVVGGHPGREVVDELHDPMHRPAPSPRRWPRKRASRAGSQRATGMKAGQAPTAGKSRTGRAAEVVRPSGRAPAPSRSCTRRGVGSARS